MEEKEAILAIAEHVLNDSDESEGIDSDLEDEYREDEEYLYFMISQKKKTLRQIVENSRVSSYSEVVAREMDDAGFKTHFGMTRDTFRVLRDHLRGRVSEKYVDLDTQLMCTLWMLGTLDSYSNTAERFKMSKGTVHFIVMRLCKELAAMSVDFIQWPSADQCSSIAAKFQEKTGFPGAVGCVDDTHIKIKESSNGDQDSDTSLSILLQGVCDADMKFTFVRVRRPGCVRDNDDAHQNSQLSQLTDKLGKQYHILGDLTYPLDPHLMTPYQNSDHLKEWHKKYNQVHKWTHEKIEHAFSQLKVRFWRLKSLDMSLLDKVTDVILACCVLYNIILEHEGPLEMTHDEMKDVLGKDCHDSVTDHQHRNRRAASKRERIARKL